MDEMDKFSVEIKAAIFRSGDEIIDSEYGWGVIQSGNDIDGYMVGFGDILAPDEFPVHELLRGVKCLSLNDALGNALLEGDYAGIRKMFEELKAERDELKAMLVRSEERAAALSDQPSAPEWKDRALKAERDLDDLQHDVGVFAECGLSMSKDDKESLRSDDSILFLETWQQEHDKLLNTEFYLRETIRLLEKRTRQAVRFMNRAKRTHAVPSLAVQKLAMAKILYYPPVNRVIGDLFDRYLKSRTCPFCEGEGVAEPDCDKPLHVDGCIVQNIEMWHQQIWQSEWMEGGVR